MQTSFKELKEEGRRRQREEKKEQRSSNEKLPIGHHVLTHRMHGRENKGKGDTPRPGSILLRQIRSNAPLCESEVHSKVAAQCKARGGSGLDLRDRQEHVPRRRAVDSNGRKPGETPEVTAMEASGCQESVLLVTTHQLS